MSRWIVSGLYLKDERIEAYGSENADRDAVLTLLEAYLREGEGDDFTISKKRNHYQGRVEFILETN